MDSRLQAIRRGLVIRKQSPGLVQAISLEKFLSKCLYKNRLVKEIAYCLSTPVEQRMVRELYRIAINSNPYKLEEWLFKVVYNKSKNYKSLKDLLIVDISILNNSKTRNVVFERYEWLKDYLLIELRKIENGK